MEFLTDLEWTARLIYNATKSTWVQEADTHSWQIHTIQIHLHHDHRLHSLVSDSDYPRSRLTGLLTGSIVWRGRYLSLTLLLWLARWLRWRRLTFTCLSAVWCHSNSSANVHLLRIGMSLIGHHTCNSMEEKQHCEMLFTHSFDVVVCYWVITNRYWYMGQSTLQQKRRSVVGHRSNHM